MTPALIAIEEAADELGVPVKALRAEAERHGFIVRIGRSIRLEQNRLGELIQKCRDQPKAHACTDTSTALRSTSQTPASVHSLRAANAAKMLKKPSRNTSRENTAEIRPATPKA